MLDQLLKEVNQYHSRGEKAPAHVMRGIARLSKPGAQPQPVQNPKQAQRTKNQMFRKLWQELHEYSGNNPELFYNNWKPRIPSVGCDCRKHWEEIEAANPPVFSSSDEFFEWGVHRHNEVNHKLGKHVLEMEEAYAFFRPRAYPAYSMDKYCYAVTALSRLPKHLEVQQKCLDSWINMGLRIYAVNTADEIKDLQKIYPQIYQFIECNETATDYEYPTQRIQRLLQVADDLDHPVALINSDIEVYGPQEYLAPNEDAVKLGVRWDYGNKRCNSQEFEWGIDVVTMTPRQSRELPKDFPFAIGHAMWDYAVPELMQMKGYDLDFLHKRYLFHKQHKVHWNKDSLAFGRQWMRDNLGSVAVTEPDWAAWRKTLDPTRKYIHGTYTARPKRVAFHHTPKCAGTSITNWLKRRYNLRWETDGLNPKDSIKEFWDKPVKADLYTGHELARIFKLIDSDIIKTTVLRHPVDRIRSLYQYLVNKQIIRPGFEAWIKDSPIERQHYKALGGVEGILSKFDVIGFYDDLDGYARELADAAGFLYTPIGKENVGAYRERIDEDLLLESQKEEILIYEEVKRLYKS